jgi:nicotinamidase-related amidase
MRLRRADSFLLVVDVQQKLAPHVHEQARVVAKSAALIRAAHALGIPVYLSEHCPERIGATLPALREMVSSAHVLQKAHFACTDEPAILSRFQGMDRKQAVVAGMEAHVCVMQTVLGLAERGFQPFLVRDAIGSRREEDRLAAIERMRAAGGIVTTAEAAMFEWMERADIPEFRDLLAIIKAL